MMTEYIERDKIGLTDLEIIMCKRSYKEALKMILDKIASIPAADVRPVVHGKWKDTMHDCHDTPHIKCSVCGEYYWQYFKKFNFCPKCGADMRG